MAPPTIAPPTRPAATPAATPRCALAGVAASEPAIVATATKAANVFFMSWALLEMAPFGGRRVSADSHAVLEMAISLESAQQSIQSKRSRRNGRKKRFFHAFSKIRPGKPGVFQDGVAVLMKMN